MAGQRQMNLLVLIFLLTIVSGLASKEQVEFKAELWKQQPSYAPDEVIIFNRVNTNKGEGYNADTGIFTAPTEGRYKTEVTVAFAGHTDEVQLMKKNESIHIIRSWPDDWKEGALGKIKLATSGLILPLKPGDKLFVKYGPGGSSQGSILMYKYTTFEAKIIRWFESK